MGAGSMPFLLFPVKTGWTRTFAGFRRADGGSGGSTRIVSDDIFITYPAFIERASREERKRRFDRLDRIGTVTERTRAVERCREASGAMSSPTVRRDRDTFMADFAMAMGEGQIKTGSACRSERIAEYNRLLEDRKGAIPTSSRHHTGQARRIRLGDPSRGLSRQAELQLVQQELVVLLRLGLTGEDERSPVRGWKVIVQHLDSGNFSVLARGRAPAPACAGALSASPEGNRRGRPRRCAPGCARPSDDRRADGKIPLQLLGRLLPFGALDCSRPTAPPGLSYEIRARRIPAFVPPAGAQARPVQRKAKVSGVTG